MSGKLVAGKNVNKVCDQKNGSLEAINAHMLSLYPLQK
jgi:hypothetical protein